ncbi:MAG: hypothetical protein PF689_01410 [Deltaproteobacteria bacterium]|jgi:hypothetical protein|nr:hypothetical protein [Deltaproteobacteria bacterium]
MIKFPFLIVIIVISLHLSTGAKASSPFDKEYEDNFSDTLFGYTTPTFSYLNFKSSEYFKINLGHLWAEKIYLSFFEFQLLGNNFFAKSSEDQKSYVNTSYFSFVKLGRLWVWDKVRFFADFHFGALQLNQVRELSNTELNNYYSEEPVLAGGISWGIKWLPRNWIIKFEQTISQTQKNTISNSTFQVDYQFSQNWLAGIIAESVERTIDNCSEETSPEDQTNCTYIFSLNYTAAYLGYRFYKEYWFLLGFGVSSLRLGLESELFKDNLGATIYLSLR